MQVVIRTLLLFFCASVAFSQPQKVHSKNDSSITKYESRIIEVPADTLSVNDSARVRVEMWLDCTNKITRTETLVDTSGKQRKISLSVYGTYVAGPYKPLCASRKVVKDFFVHFPVTGDWIVETNQAKDEHEQKTQWIISVR